MALYNVLNRDLTEDPATLGANIDSGDVTLVLTSGDGAKLPTTDACVMMVQFNDQSGTYRQAQDSGVLKYEEITFTTNSTDTLTGVVRGIGATSPQSFSAGSYVLNTISQEIYEKLSEFVLSGLNPYTQEVIR